MKKNMISFPFVVPGCCLCLVWLLACCVFLPTATAGHETEQNRLGLALSPFYFFGMTYP